MKQIIYDFKMYCKNHPNYIKRCICHEDLVNDYMFNHRIYGEDIFNALIEVSKTINKI